MKITRRTSITSTIGVTLISERTRRSDERDGKDIAMQGSFRA
jgi:hypothetical protein